MKRLTGPLLVGPASLVLVTGSLLGMAWWAGRQIEHGLVTESARATALALSRVISLPWPELSQGPALTSEHIALLQRLVGTAPQGQTIVAFKVWSPDGRVIYSTNATLIGQVFPVKGELARALRGETVYGVSDLADVENILERGRWQRLLEIYSPVENPTTHAVTAVIELYQDVAELENAARQAQTASWLRFGAAAGAVVLLLAAFVRQDGRTLHQERSALNGQLAQLRERLTRSEAARERQLQAAAGLVTAHERALRQLQADFNAGPAQNLCYVLLEFEQALAEVEQAAPTARLDDHLRSVDHGLRLAYRELGTLLKPLPLPPLEQKTPAEVIHHASLTHQQQTGLAVDLHLAELPAQAPLFLKITLYRLVLAALRATHAETGEARQHLLARQDEDRLQLELWNEQGAPANAEIAQASHLEIRWRVESLGGQLAAEAFSSADRHLRLEIPVPSTTPDWR